MDLRTFTKIVMWLYTQHETKQSGAEWRQSFIAFLQTLVDDKEITYLTFNNKKK